MGRFLRNKNYPGDEELVVDRHIGTAYDVVRTVYDNLTDVTTLATALDAGDLLDAEAINSLAKLNALVLDATLGDSADFATAAQGAKADTAVQPAGLSSYLQATDLDSLAELNAIVLDATLGDSSDFATAAQGTKADSAIQPSDNISTLTNDSGFEANPDVVPQAEAEAGTATTERIWTAERVSQAITALAPAGSVSASNKEISGTTYTILEADNGKVLYTTNGAAVAITLPDGLSVGHHFSVVQVGAGTPTVTPSGSDTVNGAGTGIATSAQWKSMYFDKYATGVWFAIS